VNAGKRILRLDLKSADGRQAFLDLLQQADVLVESFRPGVLDKLARGRPVIEAANPRLVHTAISGWGQNGPFAGRAGHEINYSGVGGGLLYGGPAERPTLGGMPVADFAAALTAVIATMAALIGRDRKQRGTLVDVSIMESVLAWQSENFIAALLEGRVGRATGLLNGGAAFYNIYRASDDRFVTIGAIEPKFWENLCAAVGRPDWIERRADPLPQDRLIGELVEMFSSQTQSYWTSVLGTVDCCFEPVLDATQTLNHPQIVARKLARSQPDFLQLLFPALMDGNRARDRQMVKEVDLAAAIKCWPHRA
jgi:alpha-methylacyl-CoA racemase